MAKVRAGARGVILRMDGTWEANFGDRIEWSRFQASVGFAFEDPTPEGILEETRAEFLGDVVDGIVMSGGLPALVRRHCDLSGAVLLYCHGHVTFGFDGATLRYPGFAYLPDGKCGWARAVLPVDGLAGRPMTEPDEDDPQELLMFRPTEYSQLHDGPPLPESPSVYVGDIAALSLVLLLADVQVMPDGDRFSELLADRARPIGIRARIASAQRHLNISTGLPFWLLEVEFAGGERLNACAPDPGRDAGDDPFPVEAVLDATAVLTGRFERAERRNPAADVAAVIGAGDVVMPEGEAVRTFERGVAIDVDVTACLGFEDYDEEGLLSSLFSTMPGVWCSVAYHPNPGIPGTGVGEGYVARVGDDGVGLCRPFPGGRCIGFVSNTDNPATPVSAGPWHVAATDCMIIQSVKRTWDLLGIDVDPDASSGQTPHPDPDELADFEEQRRNSHEPDDFYDVWRAWVPHIDERDEVVFLDRYGDRVKVVGVLREVRTWTPSLSEDGRGEHPVANLRLGDREVVVHFPPSAGSVIEDGSVIHGYVTTCSAWFEDLDKTAVYFGQTGQLAGVRSVSSDEVIGRLMKGPMPLCGLAEDFAVSLPRMARELERAGRELNVGIR